MSTKKSSVTAWAIKLQETHEGQAKLSNILHDSRKNCLSRPILERFFKKIDQAWENSNPSSSADDVLQDTIMATDPSDLCQGPDVLQVYWNACSRVMNEADLIERHLKKRLAGYPIGKSLSRRQIEILEKYGFDKVAKKNTMMRTRRPFAWVTRTDLLAQVYRTANAAETARKLLGLYHFKKDQRLVEIQYPANSFEHTGLCRPTFLEASGSSPYRSKEDPEGWGCAVDLETYDDGLPEAVHPQIPFTEQFGFKSLGHLSSDPPGCRWDEFLKGCPHPWNPSAPGAFEGYV